MDLMLTKSEWESLEKAHKQIAEIVGKKKERKNHPGWQDKLNEQMECDEDVIEDLADLVMNFFKGDVSGNELLITLRDYALQCEQDYEKFPI